MSSRVFVKCNVRNLFTADLSDLKKTVNNSRVRNENCVI